MTKDLFSCSTGAAQYARVFGHSCDVSGATAFPSLDDEGLLEVEVSTAVRDVDEDRSRTFVHHWRYRPGGGGRWFRGARLPQEQPQEVHERPPMAAHCTDAALLLIKEKGSI